MLGVLDTPVVLQQLSRLSRMMRVLDTPLVLQWLSGLSRLIVGFGHPFGAPIGFHGFHELWGSWTPVWCSCGFHGFYELWEFWTPIWCSCGLHGKGRGAKKKPPGLGSSVVILMHQETLLTQKTNLTETYPIEGFSIDLDGAVQMQIY